MAQWKKYRTKEGNHKILVPDYYESDGNDSQNQSKYSQAATWIGALSQAAMLIVVLFGYFYTVRPVFQHQLLQEKLATAELDRLRIEEQIQSLKTEKDQAEDSLRMVKNQVASVEAERMLLQDKLDAARERARQSKNQATELEIVIQEQLSELEIARWELLMLDFSLARAFNIEGYFTLDWNERQSFLEYLQRNRDAWPDPFLALRGAIVKLRERNAKEPRYPDSYIEEFDSFIKARKGTLICDAPQFDRLESSFRERSSEIESIAQQKTDEYIDKMVSEYRERGERVEITDKFRNRTSNVYRLREEFDLERELKDEVREHLESCRLVAEGVVKEFRNMKGVSR